MTARALAELKSFHFRDAILANVHCTVARTGYTGEDGVEIFCAPADAPQLWRTLVDLGRELGLVPAGLGARDTLRLEARLSLYGNDIDETTNPIEAGLGWVVKLDKRDFVGKAALAEDQGRGPGAQARRLRDDGPRHRAPRLSVCTTGRREGRRLHERQPRPHRRQEHRPRLPARDDERDRQRVRGRLPRPHGRGGRGEDAFLQARPDARDAADRPGEHAATPNRRGGDDMQSDDASGPALHEGPRVGEAATAPRCSVGITAFAVEQLGDITLVNLDVKPGDTITAGKAFGTIESVKTLSDLFAPISGKVARVNAARSRRARAGQRRLLEKGWMIAIEPCDAGEVGALLDAAAYSELLKTAAH